MYHHNEQWRGMSSRRSRLRRSRRTSGSAIALRVGAVVLVVVLTLSLAGAAFGVNLIQSWLKDLPDYTSKGAFDVAQTTRIYSADGKLLARLFLENRQTIPISQMATDLANGVVAVEDERYYEHNGVDPIGIVRAAVNNLKGGGRQGGSTITQQYVRQTILRDEALDISLSRKVREAFLAMELEKRHTKREILEMYLNSIYLGEGAYGAEAASRIYFSKGASGLTLAEAALIAGLAQQPSRLDPYINPDGAIARRNEVLAAMLANGYIDKTAYDEALATKLALLRSKDPVDGVYAAHYFVAQVKKELQQQFSPGTVFKGGLTVYTTVDTRLQRYAEEAVNASLNDPSDPRAALVSIDPRNGHVRALVGGPDFRKSKFNYATQGRRQPGSSFKTFALVAAIEKGMPPYFRIDSSSPAIIPTKPKAWSVSNSEGSGHGLMTLEAATRASVNTVFARVAWEIGAKSIASTAKRMGITTPLSNYPSIALGSQNVTPLEMASAYGTLATGGERFPPITITRVVDREGKDIFNAKPVATRVLKPSVAGVVNGILKGVITSGTARRANIGRPAAGKTGTSQNYRDVWFVGYTPQLVTSVWVGHPTERPIYVNGRHAFGGTVAAPIWASYMKRALAGEPKLDFAKAGTPTYTPSKFHIPVRRPPSVKDKGVDDAKGRLKGYKVTVEYVFSSKPKGTVLSQSSRNGKVTLVVSKGPKPAAKPTPPVAPPPPPSGNTSGTPTP